MINGEWGTCSWTLDFQGNLALSGGIATGIYELRDIPWVRFLNDIRSFYLEGPVYFDREASLDMMFFTCANLEQVDFTGFNTSNVTSMKAMFAECKSLKILDMSNLNLARVNDTTDMFYGTESMISLSVPRGFKPQGGNISSARKTNIGGKCTYYIPGSSFLVKYDPNGGIGDAASLNTTVIAGETTRVANNVFGTQKKAIFKCWNTRRDGTGTNFRPGDNLLPVYTDVTLYAIWAGIPIIGRVEDIEPITYGQHLALKIPEYSNNEGPEPNWSVQISPDGWNKWTDINPNIILPAKGNGCYIRYKAKTLIGEAVSDAVRITINKADYDMSEAKWVAPKHNLYNGKSKRCRIEGLPDGVTAIYKDEEAIEPGEHISYVSFEFDDANYNYPSFEEEFRWRIEKADFDLSNAKWKYEDNLIYDGNEKSVSLEGLPDGLGVIYLGNTGTECGEYKASVEYAFNAVLYNEPQAIPELDWRIQKKSFDMSSVHWREHEEFVFDGKTKVVSLTGLPAGVMANHEGNTAIDAGVYHATVSFMVNDEQNYEIPEPIEYDWEIKKAVFDVSQAVWDYYVPFIYDNTEKKVSLTNIPNGIVPTLNGNINKNVGRHTASVSWKVLDEDNFIAPPDSMLEWRIEKGYYDMSQVCWQDTDFVFDGSEKRIELVNLPEGITANYYNNTAVDSGSYEASAEFTYDKARYNCPHIPTHTWNIKKADLDMQNVFWDYNCESLAYDGLPKKVTLVNLPEVLEVNYIDNEYTNAGEYLSKAVLSLKEECVGNYNLPTVGDCRWIIERADIDTDGIIWGTKSLVYNADEQSVEITNLPELLEVKYQDNQAINVGIYYAKAQFTVKDNMNYNTPEEIVHEWSIVKADYDMNSVYWDYSEPMVYNGKLQCVQLLNLPLGVRAEYSGNKESQVGEYTARAEFIFDNANYNVPVVHDCSWEILKAEFIFENVQWDYSHPFTYDGKTKNVRLKNLPAGVEAVYSDPVAIDCGCYETKAEIFLPDEDNYRHPLPKVLSWEIQKTEFDMRRVYWAYTDNYVYNGEAHTVELKGVPDGVSVSYEQNTAVNAGKYRATAAFSVEDERNYYVPSKMQLEWRIKKADFNLGETKWCNDLCFEFNGSERSVYLIGLPSGAHAEYSGNTQTHCGEYFATAEIVLDEAQNYEKPLVQGTSWKIIKTQADIGNVKWDYNYSFEYDGTAKKIALINLPEGVSATYSGNVAVNAGSYNAVASFSVDNTRDYYPPADIQLQWEIKKADINLGNTCWDFEDGIFMYDGSVKKVILKNLPDGISAEYRGNSEVFTGEYIASATLRIDDTKNFNTPTISDLKWRIEKGNLDFSRVEWDYNGPYVYNGDIQTIKLKGLPEGTSAIYCDNEARDAGTYKASAVICVDTANYNIPVVDDFEWKIDKAVADIGDAQWNYEHSYIFDDRIKSVELINLPLGMRVKYHNNEKKMAGEYYATAEIELVNDSNHYPPTIDGCSWCIEKGEYDLSELKWDVPENAAYDGLEKSVRLIGLPKNILPKYEGDKHTDAGHFRTTVTFIYDESNYNQPSFDAVEWSIAKADISMAGVRWDYSGAFDYNGSENLVLLEGVPESIKVSYSGNIGKDAGEYRAVAKFEPLDPKNFHKPRDMELYWGIIKADYDLRKIEWAYGEEFKYDGKQHKIELNNVPKGIEVEYKNNKAVDAGIYTAEAILHAVDTRNFNQPGTLSCSWKINRADIDMSNVVPSYRKGEFTYSGRPKTVTLKNLPKGVLPDYHGNTAIDAGEYLCTVNFVPKDSANYNAPSPISFSWEIEKAKYNMDLAHWYKRGNYIYDGSEKSVKLVGLPHGLEAEYFEASAVNAGEYTARVILTGDSLNYEPVQFDEFVWSIEKAEPSIGKAKWVQPEDMVYDGNVKTVVLQNLPAGMTAMYEDNSHIDAGTYEARCTISMDDPNNYEAPEIAPYLWNIAKADFDTSNVEWNYEEAFEFDSKRKEVGLMQVGGEKGIFGRFFTNSDGIQYVGLPKGSRVEYENNSAVACGEYTAIASIIPHDLTNYEMPAPLKLKWKIVNKEAE